MIASQGTDVPRMVAWGWVGAVVVLAGAAAVVGRWRERIAVLALVAAIATLPAVPQLASEESIP